MLRLRLIEKLSLTAIGERTGVSQERVRQLLHVYYGLDGKRRGWSCAQRQRRVGHRHLCDIGARGISRVTFCQLSPDSQS
jgi:hypothetical protein